MDAPPELWERNEGAASGGIRATWSLSSLPAAAQSPSGESLSSASPPWDGQHHDMSTGVPGDSSGFCILRQ